MRKLALLVSLAVFLASAAVCAAAGMATYCQGPPAISASGPPSNILLVLAANASMAFPAYSHAGDPATSAAIPYDPNKLYEGYFDPEKNYQLDASGVWSESNDGTAGCEKICTGWACKADADPLGTCTQQGPQSTHGCKNKQYACCNSWAAVACGASEEGATYGNGNWLNYRYMSRMDVLRWAMTGGAPDGCNGSVKNCDIKQYGTPSAGVQCDVDADGLPRCLIRTTSGERIRARWDRLVGDNGGLLYQLKKLQVQPRLGIMVYSGNSSGLAPYSIEMQPAPVLLGDFTGSSNDADAVNPYKNTITAVNTKAPAGFTPTGPALWAARAYLAQKSPIFGSPSPSSKDGSANWKNPMYQCVDKNNDGQCQGNELVQIPCAKNFIILLSDGQWNLGGLPNSQNTLNYSCSIDTPGGYSTDGYSADPVVAAYSMHKTGFTNEASGIDTRVDTIYTLGLWGQGNDNASMQQIALYGGFDISKQWPGNLSGFPQATCTTSDCPKIAKGSRCASLPPSSPDWDKNGDGIPDNYLAAADAVQIKNQIIAIMYDLMKKASSGTAVSVLGASDGSGAFMLQTLFYPKRSFNGNTEVVWTSDLMNYWYYLDPYFSAMLIHEDTVRDGSDYTLFNIDPNSDQDYITNFTYEQGDLLASRWQATGDNASLNNAIDKGQVPIESSRAIWRAGFNLWWTEPSARTVFTSLDGSALKAFNTDTANSDTLAPYLGQSTRKDANTIINYVLGYDCADATSGLACTCGSSANCAKIGRSRTVTTGVCSTSKSPCVSSTDCPARSGETCNQESHVWKLGDITSSTPRPMSAGALNVFNRSAPYGYSDQSYDRFVKSNEYQNRQLVFSGANDGMFHAFRLGKLLQTWPGKEWWQVAKLEGGTGPEGIGTEAYAFIPKNVLPYLQYLKNEDYCHIYMVDGPITLTDAAINCGEESYWDCPKITTMTAVSGNGVDFAGTSWRAVAIGSMGLGGATCSGSATTKPSLRTETPLTVDKLDVGWSSYFAMDVTEQTNPKLLWEFSHPDLGVTNVGAGIVRVGEKDKNGRWFAVLASGSTGPIVNGEFQGASDQTLKLFILDLKTGQLARPVIDTGIANAFAGSISGGTIDLQKDKPNEPGNYQDDILYIGYVQNGTKGGVLRLVINNEIDPAKWSWSKVFADGELGPVTSSVASLIDRRAGKLWLYFGEGRYFYKQDDLNSQRRLFGVQDTCFNSATNAIDLSLSTCAPLQVSALQNQTSNPTTVLGSAKQGWYIQLAAADSSSGAERVVASPAIDPQGGIFFVSIAPTTNVCDLGGKNRTWAVDYKSGGKVGYILQGKILIQTSTGEIKEIDLSTAFSENSNRSSAWTPGTSMGAPTLIGNPAPIDRFMHIQEE